LGKYKYNFYLIEKVYFIEVIYFTVTVVNAAIETFSYGYFSIMVMWLFDEHPFHTIHPLIMEAT
jgi:hypothetical protein